MPTRRLFLGATSTAAMAALLAGCSRGVPKAPAVTGTPVPQPVLDGDRLTAALDRITTALSEADRSWSADALDGYLSGPALSMRSAEYTLAGAIEDSSVIHSFSASTQAAAVGLGVGFPRTAMLITEPTDEKTVPYLLTLDQESARSNFTLWSWLQLYPGVTIPATKTPTEGSEQVTGDTAGMSHTPDEVLAAYVDVLNYPEGDNSSMFGDDKVRQWVASQRAIDVSGAGEVTVTAYVGDDGVRGLATADGGAIIASSLTVAVEYKKTVAGADFKVGGRVAKLLGSEDVVGTVTATYLIQVGFSVAPADSTDTPVCLGSDIVLYSVTKDDSAAPAEG